MHSTIEGTPVASLLRETDHALVDPVERGVEDRPILLCSAFYFDLA